MQVSLVGKVADNTLADISNKRGISYQMQGKLDLAIEFYQDSLKIREKLYASAPNFFLGDARHNMGAIFVQKGEYKKGAEFLERAQFVWQTIYGELEHGPVPLTVYKTKLAQALAAIGLRDWTTARTIAKEALAGIRRTIEVFVAQSSEAEAINVASEIGVFQSAYLTACMNSQVAPDLALVTSNKALVFSMFCDRYKKLIELSRMNSEVAETIQQWREIRLKLATRITSKMLGSSAQLNDEIHFLAKEKERLERMMPANVATNCPTSIDATELCAIIGRKAVFVDFIKYNLVDPKVSNTTASQYGAQIFNTDTSPAFIPLGSACDIESSIVAWSGQISRGHREDAANDLARLVWQPIAKLIASPDIDTILISPDGELAKIPWVALPIGGNGEVLLERYRVALVPNGNFLIERLRQRSKRESATCERGTFLLVSNVDFGQLRSENDESLAAGRLNQSLPFRPLPGTVKEAELIRPLVSKMPETPKLVELSAAAATVERVCAELTNAELAHIATHGTVSMRSDEKSPRSDGAETSMTFNGIRVGTEARNPLNQVAIVLSGANLTPIEGKAALLSGEVLAALDLRGCRLCVLSNCHTATGETTQGLGLFGIPVALHQAGVEEVIASLWAVSDEVSPEMMAMFYKRFAAGEPAIDALRSCQLHAMRNPIFSNSRGQRGSEDFEEFSTDDTGLSLDLRMTVTPRGLTRDWAGFVISGIG